MSPNNPLSLSSSPLLAQTKLGGGFGRKNDSNSENSTPAASTKPEQTSTSSNKTKLGGGFGTKVTPTPEETPTPRETPTSNETSNPQNIPTNINFQMPSTQTLLFGGGTLAALGGHLWTRNRAGYYDRAANRATDASEQLANFNYEFNQRANGDFTDPNVTRINAQMITEITNNNTTLTPELIQNNGRVGILNNLTEVMFPSENHNIRIGGISVPRTRDNVYPLIGRLDGKYHFNRATSGLLGTTALAVGTYYFGQKAINKLTGTSDNDFSQPVYLSGAGVLVGGGILYAFRRRGIGLGLALAGTGMMLKQTYNELMSPNQ